LEDLRLTYQTSYSRAPEILEYFKNVAKKYDLYRFINLNHSVINAEWVESDSIWKIKVQDNATGRIIDDWCHFMITASGILKCVGACQYLKKIYADSTTLATGSGLIFRVYTASRVNSFTAQRGTRMSHGRARLLQSLAAVHQACRSYPPFSQARNSELIVSVLANTLADVKQLVTFIRTPTWITAGFAQNKAGPNGSNFACT
jgi:hypothetical protein